MIIFSFLFLQSFLFSLELIIVLAFALFCLQILPRLWKSPQVNGHTVAFCWFYQFILKTNYKLHYGLVVLHCQHLGINTEAQSSNLSWLRQLRSGKAGWLCYCPMYHSHLSVIWCGAGWQEEAEGTFKLGSFGEPLIKGLFTEVWARMGKRNHKGPCRTSGLGLQKWRGEGCLTGAWDSARRWVRESNRWKRILF